MGVGDDLESMRQSIFKHLKKKNHTKRRWYTSDQRYTVQYWVSIVGIVGQARVNHGLISCDFKRRSRVQAHANSLQYRKFVCTNADRKQINFSTSKHRHDPPYLVRHFSWNVIPAALKRAHHIDTSMSNYRIGSSNFVVAISLCAFFNCVTKIPHHSSVFVYSDWQLCSAHCAAESLFNYSYNRKCVANTLCPANDILQQSHSHFSSYCDSNSKHVPKFGVYVSLRQ